MIKIINKKKREKKAISAPSEFMFLRWATEDKESKKVISTSEIKFMAMISKTADIDAYFYQKLFQGENWYLFSIQPSLKFEVCSITIIV